MFEVVRYLENDNDNDDDDDGSDVDTDTIDAGKKRNHSLAVRCYGVLPIQCMNSANNVEVT